MKIHIASGTAASYLAEILTTGGLCFHAVQFLQEVRAVANPEEDILILPQDSEVSDAEAFLRAGGKVIAIQPGESLLRHSGLKLQKRESGTARLRFVKKICPGSRGEPLWTHGKVDLYEPCAHAGAFAYLFNSTNADEETPGIIECEVGAGRLMIYAYDPALCIARLRQGYPERANFLPKGQLTPRAAFLQLPDPPTDTFWRPTADLHASGFCEIVRHLMEVEKPVPSLWHLPDGVPSILLFSGDEDGATQEENDLEMKDIESFEGSMNLYVIPDITTITREHIEDYTGRGHSVSVHPNLTGAASASPEEQVAVAERQVRLFQEKFSQPVQTLRNHSYMWPGYLDLPELWERLGIGMDANVTSMMRGESRDFGPFAKLNTALPMRYVRENGGLIDVFQQPTQINDDLLTNPESPKSHKYSLEEFGVLMERVFDDAVRINHSPICVNFHPGNFSRFSGAYGRELLQKARERQLPVWSIDRWHNYWRARSSWSMSAYSWQAPFLQITFQGMPCEGLVIQAPQKIAGRALSQIKTNAGVIINHRQAVRSGRQVGLIPIPDGASEMTLCVEYIAV